MSRVFRVPSEVSDDFPHLSAFRLIEGSDIAASCPHPVKFQDIHTAPSWSDACDWLTEHVTHAWDADYSINLDKNRTIVIFHFEDQIEATLFKLRFG